MPISDDRSYRPSTTSAEGRLTVKRNPDATSMRGIAHPVRIRILDILRMEGPATATTLAEKLGVRTGSTSWHLQKLAEHGFIEEIADRGTRRERWWRAVGVSVQYAEAMEAGQEQAVATTEYMTMTARHEADRAVAFLHQEWSFDWRYAAIFNTFDHLVLDPSSLDEMRNELWSIVQRYAARPSTTPDAERIIVTMHAYPYRADEAGDAVQEAESTARQES